MRLGSSTATFNLALSNFFVNYNGKNAFGLKKLLAISYKVTSGMIKVPLQSCLGATSNGD
jgi:hypothetical protein